MTLLPFPGRHPSFKRLSEYVDLGEDQPDWAQLRRHLRGCTRCRDEVAWLRRLSEEAGKLGPVQPPAGTLDQILDRRAAGERVILPSHGAVGEDDWSPPPAMWAIAVLIGGLAVLWVTLLLAPHVSAGDNDLTFEPRSPRAGDVLEIRYRATTGLIGADSLRLRAHFRPAARGAEDEEFPGARVEVSLLPDEEGVYLGRLTIPPLAAYGQIAVEDHQASYVDTNDGRLWEVLTHDAEGERYEALHQRLAVAEGSDWRRMLETAHRMTERFPDDPGAWYARLAVERQVLGSAVDDSLLVVHRRALHGILAAAATPDLSAAEMTLLTEYAGAVGDTATAAFWRRMLERQAPRHAGTMRLRAFDLVMSDLKPSARLAGMDSLWAGADRGDATVARLAFDLAVGLEDADGARVWAERWDSLQPGWGSHIGRRLATIQSTLPAAVEYLRAALGEEAPRPLDLTAEEWNFRRRDRRQEVVAVLARALLDLAAVDEVKTLVREARNEIDPGHAAQLAEVMLSVSDSVAAVHLLAQAAADPVAPEGIARRGRQLAGAVGMSDREWSELLTAYRHRLRTTTSQRAAYRVLRPEITVMDESGRTLPLRSLAEGRPTLVAVEAAVTRESIPGLADRFRAIHREAERLGYPFVAVAAAWQELDLAPPVFSDLEFPVYIDRANSISQALGIWTMTAYVVLDADGAFRGTFQDVDEALRLLSFLPSAALAA